MPSTVSQYLPKEQQFHMTVSYMLGRHMNSMQTNPCPGVFQGMLTRAPPADITLGVHSRFRDIEHSE